MCSVSIFHHSLSLPLFRSVLGGCYGFLRHFDLLLDHSGLIFQVDVDMVGDIIRQFSAQEKSIRMIVFLLRVKFLFLSPSFLD